ncbi:MAG: DMT family transporter [Promethearchaeota archaeon]
MPIQETKNSHISPKVSKVCMFTSAINMGFVGFIISFLSGYPIYAIVLLRGIFGTFFLTIFMIKSHSLNKDFLKESFSLHWKSLIIIGIINPLVIYFYFININISGFAFAAFMLYTSGVFLLLIIFLTRSEEVSRINYFSFILAVIGVGIIMEFWTGNIFSSSLFFGLLSGITLAILTFYKKKIYRFRHENAILIKSEGDFDMFLAWWATMFIIFLFLPFGITYIERLTIADLIIALILGFFPTALAFWLYNIGIKNDEGGNIVILAYFEPIMATILTIIIVKELSIFTIIGGALIIFANFFILKHFNNN